MIEHTAQVPPTVISRQASQYDKILRENMEVTLPGIIKHLLQLNILSTSEIPDDLQYTKERKPDLLKKVTGEDGKTYILHLEYQSGNDKSMVYRMAEYSIMLQRKYRLWVKQFVIYIGIGKPKMEFQLKTEDFQFRYHLLSLSDMDYKTFLKSAQPEDIILGVLANFNEEAPLAVIGQVLKRIKLTAGGALAESRYMNQVRVLLQLRNLENQFYSAMESIKAFSETRDPYYQRGEVKGLEKGMEKGIKKGIKKGGLLKAIDVATKLKAMGIPVSAIAKGTGLSIAKVKKLA